MAEGKASYALGAIMYLLGLIAVNSILQPLANTQIFHPALELALISLGVFLLSSLYYGNYSYLLLLVCGLYFGSSIAQHPFLSVFAAIPLLYAMAAGSEMGEMAVQDFRGKTNFFELKGRYAANAVWVLGIAVLIGFVMGNLTFSNLPTVGNIDLSGVDVNGFLNGLRIQ